VALVEQLALGLMVPFNLPDAPPERAAVVVEELKRRGDPGAAGMLSAISVFAHEPLAGLASQALGRLRASGGSSRPSLSRSARSRSQSSGVWRPSAARTT
jgi:hypothetical protein